MTTVLNCATLEPLQSFGSSKIEGITRRGFHFTLYFVVPNSVSTTLSSWLHLDTYVLRVQDGVLLDDHISCRLTKKLEETIVIIGHWLVFNNKKQNFYFNFHKIVNSINGQIVSLTLNL